MPRAFPVPVYTTTTSTPSASVRLMSTTSPGTTDSTATSVAGSLGSNTYLVPEAASAAGTVPATPAPVGSGWALPISALVPATDSITISAGTWTVAVAYLRDNGLGTADHAATIHAYILRVNAAATTNISEIGRASAGVTVTATKQTVNINITGVQTDLLPGERIMLVVGVVTASALLTTDRYPTNSATALRITAAPPYAVQAVRAINDTQAVSDTLARQVGYSRPLDDSQPVTDSLARRVDRFRTLADSPTVTDTLARRVDSNRALADTMAASSDTLTRRVALNRQLADSAAVAETLQRKVGYSRKLQDDLSAGGGTTVIVRRMNVVADD